MKPSLVDTNVIVRFLIGDHKDHHAQAERWFSQGEQGVLELVIPSLVVAETVFVLESFYKKPHAWTAEAMTVLVSQRWLRIEERDVLVGALAAYREGRHFVDSYLLAKAKRGGTSLLTFDQKLQKVVSS